MNIIISNLREKMPVFHKYPQQFTVQPAYIELDCRGEGEILADYNAEIGSGVPEYVWHHHAIRWRISAKTTRKSLKALFKDAAFLAVCHRILAGYESEWNGSNHVGKYCDDAQEAIMQAKILIETSLETK